MRRVAQRDSTAFETLYETYSRVVFRIGLQLLGDAASAEDLKQSVFFKVWSNPTAFKGGSFTAWISRVARNGGVDVVRRRSTDARTLFGEPPGDAFEDTVVARLEAERVRDALARLPHKERSLIEMGYFGGMTYHGVATTTGVPLGTVKTRIRSGLQRLRHEFVIADGSAYVPTARCRLRAAKTGGVRTRRTDRAHHPDEQMRCSRIANANHDGPCG